MFNFVSERNKASMRHCAFCQNWYDPTNSVIRPKNGIGNWEYEHCIKRNVNYEVLTHLQTMLVMTLFRKYYNLIGERYK